MVWANTEIKVVLERDDDEAGDWFWLSLPRSLDFGILVAGSYARIGVQEDYAA